MSNTTTVQAAKDAAVEVATAVIRDENNDPVAVPAAVAPTQMRYPWKSSLRTAFQAFVALAAMWALIIEALDLPDWAWVGTSVAIAAGITRVMSLPAVELWLRRYFPFLSAAPKPDEVPPNPLRELAQARAVKKEDFLESPEKGPDA